MKQLLFTFAITILFLPIFLFNIDCNSLVRPLDGTIEEVSKPAYSKRLWFNGIYQEQLEKYVQSSLPGRDFFVRLVNSWRYILFHQTNVKNVLVGKSDVLYQDFYVDALLGRDLVDRKKIIEDVRKFKVIQDSLLQNGKLFLLVIAPGKPSVYPEFLPDSFFLDNITQSNYSMYVNELKSKGCFFIDARNWFIELKSNSKYPLFPKNGTHWSGHTVPVLMDSIARFVEAKVNFELDDFNISPGVIENSDFRFTDNDIGKTLNLLHEPSQWSLTYPLVKFETTGNKKPQLLSIGDSFNQSFWGFYPFFKMLFGVNTQQWYYNKLIAYPDDLERKMIEVKKLDIYSEVMSRDIILIVSTEQNLNNFCFEFTDQFYPYAEFGLQRFGNRKDEYIFKIKSDSSWMNQVRLKATTAGIPLDTMIQLDANWMVLNAK
ncbi:MAG: hypothetical protein KBB64_03145 [Bacteroidia bacterium]|nr:hypothetical protein [Bacteroidia bacterium]